MVGSAYDELARRLEAHLEHWLGAWPPGGRLGPSPQLGELVVVHLRDHLLAVHAPSSGPYTGGAGRRALPH